MPTFDFSNILRKIVAAAVSVAASPITAVLAGATILATFADEIVSFFSSDFSWPAFSLSSLPNLTQESNEILSLVLYAVDFDKVISFVDSVCSFFSGLLSFGVKFISSLLLVLVTVGAYKVVRKQLKDAFG